MNSEFSSKFFWINYSFLLFFITAWVIQIAMWIIYINRMLKRNKELESRAKQYITDCTLKNLEVEEWKLKLMKKISYCEIIALILGFITISIHRIEWFNHQILVHLALNYVHDLLYLIGLYQIWKVLRLLNILVKYLRGVCDWHQHKPDTIKRELNILNVASLVFIIIAGLWPIAVLVGLALIACIVYEYIHHIIYSFQLWDALKRLAKDYSYQHTEEGRANYRAKKQERRKYGLFATLIIIGIFFWIAPTGLSLFGVAVSQIRFVSMWRGFHLDLEGYVPIIKVYLTSLTDILISIGGAFLFPVHICFALSHFKLMSFNQCCIRRKKKESGLCRPLV